MKKIILSVALVAMVFVLFGCGKSTPDFAVDSVKNLAEIVVKSSEAAQEYAKGNLSLVEFEKISAELEAKYEEIAGVDFEELGEDLEEMKEELGEKIEEQKEKIKLPEWAKKRWLSEPEWMELEDEESSVSSVDIEGFDSMVLVYEGKYETAMAEAKKIAEKANIPVSSEFAAAQEMISNMTEDERMGLDMFEEDMTKGIIYTNHSLLETNFDKLITISVDEFGELIIEAVNYAQIK